MPLRALAGTGSTRLLWPTGSAKLMGCRLEGGAHIKAHKDLATYDTLVAFDFVESRL